MNKHNSIYIGNTPLHNDRNDINGEQVMLGNENFFKITNVNHMRPFFMSIVSPSNHWMFISSNGGLSAGRKNSEHAIFPYYTDDKITEFAHITGSKTILKVTKNNKIFLWEPFSNFHTGAYKIAQNLYKNSYGNKVVFEEINEDLQLAYTYQWNSSEKFGFIKKASLKNLSNQQVNIEVLDGVQNIIPHGVGEYIQNSSSNLVDAYKRSEINPQTGLGIYALSAIIVDKAEPSEALKTNVVWSLGLSNSTYLASSLQLNKFRNGIAIQSEDDVKAEKGAYFVVSKITLAANSEKKWLFAADVNKSIVDVIDLEKAIQNNKDLYQEVLADVEAGTQQLIELTGNADGIQLTQDKLVDARHFANTMFNIMRGGIFDNNYDIEKADFLTYLEKANKNVYTNNQSKINNLPNVFSLQQLKEVALATTDADFKRLCFEYLPLKFSRRHGDPSRPWNKFSINTKSEVDGSKILDYQGNWRDIFQNWEALAHSYPEFIENMIHKFLNATTFDGYNPYRVTKDGFDWETIEPDDPWSYIGYWGDHQIIYLLKFLEFSEKYYPGNLTKYFSEDVFVYANVPYVIKPYGEILKNSKDTIDFNHKADSAIRKNREELGADGALLTVNDNEIYRVNLIEKLLATVMAKLSNFIPEGGIWMNTQRPEWNDANNALVGNGVSMVTLYYLRRFLNFLKDTLEKTTVQNFEISKELVAVFENMNHTFENHANLLGGNFSNSARKTVLDKLGIAASNFRTEIYNTGFSNTKATISSNELKQFISLTLLYLEHSINANKREDNLYHAYNLMTIENNEEVSISYLPEMLEGQVAVLSSGYLSSKEALTILNALRNSALYREDQNSYILYPNKQLPRFKEKNIIPAYEVQNAVLLKQLIADNNKQIIEVDALGNYHFNGNFNNANSLKAALKNLPKAYTKLVEKETATLLAIFEEVFNHKAFTGRSGTFFGYEGLGSIYWHMVSKLHLSVQEVCLKAIENNDDEVVVNNLKEHYYQIGKGIGVHKTPEVYGAFTTDPYSHTPQGKGAQQPGMTGQVKEDVLTRFGELGLVVNDGQLNFKPYLLSKNEFLNQPEIYKYYNLNAELNEFEVPKNALCFTTCLTPVIYKLADENKLKIEFENETKTYSNLNLDTETSSHIFKRNGVVKKITVSLKK